MGEIEGVWLGAIVFVVAMISFTLIVAIVSLFKKIWAGILCLVQEYFPTEEDQKRLVDTLSDMQE